MFVFLLNQTSCGKASRKNLVNLCYPNPANWQCWSERVRITCTTQQVRKHIWYWTDRINPVFDTREVTAFSFWSVFSTIPSIPEYSWDFLTLWMNPKLRLETAWSALSPFPNTIKKYKLNLWDPANLTHAAKKHLKCEHLPKVFCSVYEIFIVLKNYVSFRCVCS